MNVERIDNNGRHSVRVDVKGMCALNEAEAIRRNLKEVFKEDVYHILFDFTECDFIDSTGLGLLVSIHKKCVEHNGRMVLYKPSDEVADLLRITRLDQVFNITK